MLEFLSRILLIIFLILLNGYFVASEYALVSVRKTRIQELVKKGNKSAKRVLKALDELDIYISSTQLGITLASLALGWIGEPTLAHYLEPLFAFLPDNISVLTSNTLAILIAFALITFFEIIFGELTPKIIALQQSGTIAMLFITPLQIFTTIFRPVITLLNAAGRVVIKWIGLRPAQERESIYTEDEIKLILSQSVKKGILEKYEVDMVHKVFRFTDLKIKDVMIPRKDIIAFNTADKAIDIFKKMKEYNHTRYPVYEGSFNTVVGYIHIKDFYQVLGSPLEEKELKKVRIIQKIISIPESKPADEVLFEMRNKKIHIAVVHNKKNALTGLVTLEDIVEDIVGEI